MKQAGPILLLLFGLSGPALGQQAGPQDSAPASPRPPASKDEAVPSPALVERQIKGRAGREIRVLVVSNVKPDCTSGPLPTVRLITPPAHGKIVMRRVRIIANNVRNCLSISVPALLGIYRSAPDFAGTDHITVQIHPETGAPQTRRLTILITNDSLQNI